MIADQAVRSRYSESEGNFFRVRELSALISGMATVAMYGSAAIAPDLRPSLTRRSFTQRPLHNVASNFLRGRAARVWTLGQFTCLGDIIVSKSLMLLN